MLSLYLTVLNLKSDRVYRTYKLHVYTSRWIKGKVKGTHRRMPGGTMPLPAIFGNVCILWLKWEKCCGGLYSSKIEERFPF
jgi:hypothetical protein